MQRQHVVALATVGLLVLSAAQFQQPRSRTSPTQKKPVTHSVGGGAQPFVEIDPGGDDPPPPPPPPPPSPYNGHASLRVEDLGPFMEGSYLGVDYASDAAGQVHGFRIVDQDGSVLVELDQAAIDQILVESIALPPGPYQCQINFPDGTTGCDPATAAMMAGLSPMSAYSGNVVRYSILSGSGPTATIADTVYADSAGNSFVLKGGWNPE